MTLQRVDFDEIYKTIHYFLFLSNKKTSNQHVQTVLSKDSFDDGDTTFLDSSFDDDNSMTFSIRKSSTRGDHPEWLLVSSSTGEYAWTDRELIPERSPAKRAVKTAVSAVPRSTSTDRTDRTDRTYEEMISPSLSSSRDINPFREIINQRSLSTFSQSASFSSPSKPSPSKRSPSKLPSSSSSPVKVIPLKQRIHRLKEYFHSISKNPDFEQDGNLYFVSLFRMVRSFFLQVYEISQLIDITNFHEVIQMVEVCVQLLKVLPDEEDTTILPDYWAICEGFEVIMDENSSIIMKYGRVEIYMKEFHNLTRQQHEWIVAEKVLRFEPFIYCKEYVIYLIEV